MNSGGGIGGLTLSAALRFLGNEDNFEIHIYEAASNVAEIGAGINFWPRSWHIMEKIGLKDKLLDLLFETPDDSMRELFNLPQ
jgi:salicylate hydroxylase